MSMTTVIVILAVLVLIFVYIRSKRSTTDDRPATSRPRKSAASSEFHAVSIKFASNACSAAKSLEGKRFLSTAAPRIPLPDCDVLECKCRFIHHRDRRQGGDRRNPYTAGFGGETGKHPVEQRKQPDRRKDPDPF
jgi:hypothetical protein